MIKSIISFVIGLVAMLVSWLIGRHGVSKAKADATQARAEASQARTEANQTKVESAKANAQKDTAEKAQKITENLAPIHIEHAAKQMEIQNEHDRIMQEIDNARRSNDMGLALEIARELAERATNH